MAISTTSRSSTSSRESVCFNQNLPKYVLSSTSSCGSAMARKRRSTGLLTLLRNKLCFCRNDHSTEDDCDVDGRTALNGPSCAEDGVRCTRHDMRLIHAVAEKSAKSCSGSAAAASTTDHHRSCSTDHHRSSTDQRSSTLPAVHRSCTKTMQQRSREDEHRTIIAGTSNERWTNKGLLTAPRTRSETTERKRATTDVGGAKKFVMDEQQMSPLLPVARSGARSRLTTRKSETLMSATVVEVNRTTDGGDVSSDSGTVKIESSDKWRLSEESSRPSSGEGIDEDDDEVYESYETTCSEPQQPGLSLPPVYDQVKEEPCPGWSLSKELSKLTNHGWYWGPITRIEAEEKLAGQVDGTFLVRDSSDDHYLLSLSFRSYGRTLHTRIEHCNNVFSLYTQTESEGYGSIVDLIENSVTDSQTGVFCYSRARTVGSLSFPVRLTRPVSRFTHVRSLQYLCRFLIRQHTRVDHIQMLPLPCAIKGFLEERQY